MKKKYTPPTPDEIKALLRSANWSVYEAAQACEVSQSTAYNWAKGVSPIPRRRWVTLRLKIGLQKKRVRDRRLEIRRRKLTRVFQQERKRRRGEV